MAIAIAGCSSGKTDKPQQTSKVKLTQSESDILGFSECDSVGYFYRKIDKTAVAILERFHDDATKFMEGKGDYTETIQHVYVALDHYKKDYHIPDDPNGKFFIKRFYNGREQKNLIVGRNDSTIVFCVEDLQSLYDEATAKFIEGGSK